jgi:hypothetical protein
VFDPVFDATTPVISQYTRADAFAAGTLVDALANDLATVTREHTSAITPQVSVALTQALNSTIDAAVRSVRVDRTGVWHDLLTMSGVYKTGKLVRGLAFAIHRAIQNGAAEKWRFPVVIGAETVTVIASIDAGDDGEPVVTLMLPEDD